MDQGHFSHAYFQSIKLSFKTLGLRSVLPWVFFLLVVFPPLYVWYWEKELLFVGSSNISTILSGCMVSIGMMGALTVNLMSQVLTLTNDEKFSDYLQSNGSFSVTIFFPQFTFLAIFFSLFVSLATIFTQSFKWLEGYFPYLFVTSIGAIAYAAIRVWGLIDLARQLAWHRRDYATLLQERIAELEAAASGEEANPRRK